MKFFVLRSAQSRVLLAAVSVATLISQTNARADDLPLQGYLDPSSPIARHAETGVKATLRIANSSTTAMKVRLDGKPFQLKNGNVRATLRFNGGKDFVAEADLPAAVSGKPGEQTFPFEAIGMTAPGSYEGAIDVTSLDTDGRHLRIPILLTRQASTFDPAVTGSNVVNGAMTIKPASKKDSQFWFNVDNPKGNSDIVVSVAAAGKLSGPGGSASAAVYPASFALSGGGTQSVRLTFTGDKGGAPDTAMWGKIVVSDLTEPGQQKSIDITVLPTFAPNGAILLLILLVVAGTSTSILVGSIMPTLMARQKAWKRLTSLNATIEMAAERGSPAQLALETQWHRIGALAHDIWWFSTRAGDLLTDLNKQIDDLQKRIDIVARASQLRSQCRQGDTTPLSVVPEIDRSLDDVVRTAVGGNLTSAETALQAVQSKIDDTTVAQTVQTSLQKRIAQLPTTAPNGSETSMAVRLQDLISRVPSLNQQLELSDLLWFDRECFVAHIYFIRYLAGVMLVKDAQTRFGPLGDRLVASLSGGTSGIWRANALMQSMELGVTPETIDAALKAGQARIEVRPSRQQVNDLVEFALVFQDPALNESPLVSAIGVKWNFGDETSPAVGWRCIHFFGPIVFKGKKRSELTAAVKISAEVAEAEPFNTEIAIQRDRLEYAIIARGEVFSTACVFFGAVVLTLISHQSDVHVFGTISDFANPFLWGFGLDRMKSLVAANP